MATRMQFQAINNDDCERVFESALRVLEEVGCNVHHEKALVLMKDAGCDVDGIRVKIPAAVMKKAMSTVPKEVKVYNQKGEVALNLSARSDQSYFVAGLENQHRLDYKTGEKRLTTKQDAYEAGLVADALPNVDVACGLSCISDCTPELADVYEVRMLLEATDKPLLVWNFTKENLKTQVELCAAVAGGMDKFLEKPFILAGAAASTPLAHAEDTLEKLMYMYELGLPTPYTAGGMLGGTAPITPIGNVVAAFADTLVGLLISQLVNEGTPFIGTCFCDYLDMKTMAFSHTNPETPWMAAAGAAVFRYLDIPFVLHLGSSDSPIFDQQAAFDITAQFYTGLLCGANLNYFTGYLECAMSSSLPVMVFCDEAVDYLKTLVRGYEINEETLSVQEFKNVGPNGNFLAEMQTMTHFKERWNTKQFIRMSYENWKNEGARDYEARAGERVDAILAAGPRNPLSRKVLDELDAIVKQAEDKLKK